MKVEIVGKNGFEPSEANKEYVCTKLEKLDQYFNDFDSLEARIVCKVYKEHHKVEITIPTKKFILRVEVSDIDLYAAIDVAIDKLIGQIRKYKTRGRTKTNKDSLSISMHDEHFNVEDLEKEMLAEQLVRNKQVELKPMAIEDAMEQMTLLSHDFFVYLDVDSNKVNVIYLRDDGQYALIETK